MKTTIVINIEGNLMESAEKKRNDIYNYLINIEGVTIHLFDNLMNL